MKTISFFAALVAITFVLNSSPSHAAEKKKDGAKSSLSESDQMFAKKAAQGGMTEVELGKVAANKGQSSEVKDFGNMMVSDHSKAGDKLKAIAASKNLTLTDKLNAKHQAIVDKLLKLDGAAFDKAYVAAMVEDHEKDLKEFQSAAKTTQDADLKAFAAETETVVKTHLDKIKAIQASMK
jgi:putative membrane protein